MKTVRLFGLLASLALSAVALASDCEQPGCGVDGAVRFG
jgi:hypothetical protein